MASGAAQRFSPGKECKRIEIALYRQPFRQFLRHPCRIDSFVEPNCRHSGLLRISAELAASALGKADDRHARMARLESAYDAGGWLDHPLFELRRRQAPGPAVE